MLNIMNNLTKDQAIFALSLISNANFGMDARLGDPPERQNDTLWTNPPDTVADGLDAITQHLPKDANVQLTCGPALHNTPSHDTTLNPLHEPDKRMYMVCCPHP